MSTTSCVGRAITCCVFPGNHPYQHTQQIPQRALVHTRENEGGRRSRKNFGNLSPVQPFTTPADQMRDQKFWWKSWFLPSQAQGRRRTWEKAHRLDLGPTNLPLFCDSWLIFNNRTQWHGMVFAVQSLGRLGSTRRRGGHGGTIFGKFLAKRYCWAAVTICTLYSRIRANDCWWWRGACGREGAWFPHF